MDASRSIDSAQCITDEDGIKVRPLATENANSDSPLIVNIAVGICSEEHA
jgi:hypothetical protein